MKRSSFIYNSLFFLAFASFIAQIFIDYSEVNVGSAFVALVSTTITLGYLRWSNAFKTKPLSSLGIFGMLILTQLSALIFQSFLWTSLTEKLRLPFHTFCYLAMFQLSAIVAHLFYRMLTKSGTNKPSIIRYSFARIGLYDTPTIKMLWMMGVVGLISYILSKGVDGSKVASGFQFAVWAPFLIPIYLARFGKAYCSAKLNYILLGLYVLLLIVVAIASNVRALMFYGVLTVVMVLLLEAFMGDAKITKSQFSKLLLLAVIGVAISFPMADLVTAMGIARQHRDKVSAEKLIEKTYEALNDSVALEKYRRLAKAETSSAYDENYLDNPILVRFVNTKFDDNMFYFGSKLRDSEVETIAKFTTDTMWAMLPAPILEWKIFKSLNIDKLSLRYSLGDAMANLAVGVNLVGYRVGSVYAQGFTLMGYWFVFVYMLLCFLIFMINDLLTFKYESGKTVIAPLGLFIIWQIFAFSIGGESITNLVTSIIRTFPQNVILYAVLFNVVKLIDRIWDALSLKQKTKSNGVNVSENVSNSLN